jgi:hypothetical protein
MVCYSTLTVHSDRKRYDVKTIQCQEIALKNWKVKMNIKELIIFHGASQNQDNFDKSRQYAGYAKSFIGGLSVKKFPL